MSTRPFASEKQSVYDEKHRKIISKESLVGAPESSSSSNEIVSSVQDDSWTQHSWQKAGSAHIPQRPGKGKKAWRHQPQLKQPNRLQKKLEEALSTPVQISKAESMMQKMGWQGGALGKTGTGIVEPVAPNAAYAIKTRGFGQATHTPDPPPPKKKKITPKKLKNNELGTFHTNVLLQILEFVKNDYENEIFFDRSLSKNERKHIHNLVNEVINENDVATLGSVAVMDLVQQIRAHNYYVLCTESQGSFPDRSLCLFKEAPEHVYLITPKDLREQSEDVDETDEKVQENSTNNQIKETQDNVNKDDKDTSISNEIVKEKNANVNVDENVHREQRDSSQSLIRESESIDECVNKELNVISSICEAVKQDAIENNGDKESKAISESTAQIKVITDEDEDVNKDISNEIKIKVNLNEGENTEPKDFNSLNNSVEESANIEQILVVKEELKDNKEPKRKDSEGNQNIDVAVRLIRYFEEFAESEDYSELRFLGPFTTEEMNHINNLVSNLYYHVNNNEDKVDEIYKEVFKGLDEEIHIFEVKEDINWSPVIYKTDIH